MGQALSERISFFRKQRGLSLRDLALKAGTTKGHVWDLEKDKSRNPTLGVLRGLSDALGVPIHVLVGEEYRPDRLSILCRWIRDLPEEDLRLVKATVSKLREMTRASDL